MSKLNPQVPQLLMLASFLRDHPTHNHVQRRALGLGISQAVIEEASQKGDEWATTASQKALMDCDKPRPETIQACQNLGSYWFSQGQTDRTNIHTRESSLHFCACLLLIQP